MNNTRHAFCALPQPAQAILLPIERLNRWATDHARIESFDGRLHRAVVLNSPFQQALQLSAAMTDNPEAYQTLDEWLAGALGSLPRLSRHSKCRGR